jgi:hypothetical protein
VNRLIATLAHALSFAVKEHRFLGRNPVSDIARIEATHLDTARAA